MFDFRRYSAAVVGVVFPFASMIPPVGGGLPLVQSGPGVRIVSSPGGRATPDQMCGWSTDGQAIEPFPYLNAPGLHVESKSLKSQIDSVWDDFWSGGISNPLEVMEQLTYLLMARVNGSDAQSALQASTRRLKHVPRCLNKTVTYDRGKEMSLHGELVKRLKIQLCFADPYSPWQRGCNETTNGLIRQYLPKGIDLAELLQTHLNQNQSTITLRV